MKRQQLTANYTLVINSQVIGTYSDIKDIPENLLKDKSVIIIETFQNLIFIESEVKEEVIRPYSIKPKNKNR